MIVHMGERLKFGGDTPERSRQTKAYQAASMFPDGEDLPLFSGTPIPAIEHPFVPEDHSMKQGMLPGMPSLYYAHAPDRNYALPRRGTPPAALRPVLYWRS